jgi:C1A family cysteine protease
MLVWIPLRSLIPFLFITKLKMIYSVAIALAVAATASARLFSEQPAFQKQMWENFKAEHKRSYATMEEENHRFQIFLENLKMADLRNEQEMKEGGSAIHGITIFSDMSQSEFESKMLTADITMRSASALKDSTQREVKVDAGLVDWSGVLTTPVKDQGYCGSCWAFSATEQIESDSMRTLSTTWILSPEQITQCATTCYGCDGGWTEKAFDYAKVNAIVLNSDYPYTSYQGTTGTCKPPKTGVVKVVSYTTLPDESSMAAYVQSTGPLSVCLDASKFNTYKGGIVTKCGKRVDHCVQAVGVDASSTGYWKVRNSWGSSWGEDGYIRLAYGQDTCAITSDPIWTSVVKA